MNRKAQGSGDELDIPKDGRKIDRPPHSVNLQTGPKGDGHREEDGVVTMIEKKKLSRSRDLLRGRYTQD